MLPPVGIGCDTCCPCRHFLFARYCCCCCTTTVVRCLYMLLSYRVQITHQSTRRLEVHGRCSAVSAMSFSFASLWRAGRLFRALPSEYMALVSVKMTSHLSRLSLDQISIVIVAFVVIRWWLLCSGLRVLWCRKASIWMRSSPVRANIVLGPALASIVFIADIFVHGDSTNENLKNGTSTFETYSYRGYFVLI